MNAALDVASSSSAYGEAWPLVLGEAMACGVPCAVTDVGDSGLIVGDTGRVVPPKNPEALADAWHELLTLPPDAKAELGLAARRRMEEYFSLASAVAKYEDLYTSLALRKGPVSPLDVSPGEGSLDGQVLRTGGPHSPAATVPHEAVSLDLRERRGRGIR